MGTRGPKPEPTATKEAKGNPGRRPIAPEVKFPGGELRCPSWLGRVGRAKWRELVGVLSSVEGLLTQADIDALAMYCDCWEVFLAARAEVEKEGATCKSKEGGVYQHPALSRKNKAIEQLRKLGSLFGLSPTERVGLHPASGNAPGDPLTEMLSRRQSNN